MRLYRALLHLYPASFRLEYQAEMMAIFARRRAAASAVLPLIRFWTATVLDVIGNAGRLHWSVGCQDVRYAVRMLARAPGFASTSLLVLALGIGATTAAFSVADHVLVRPLPFARADRLVKLWQDESFRGVSRMEVSPANYEDWNRQATSFDSMAAFTTRSANLVGQGDAERLDSALVTTDLFNVLQVQAARGRTLMAADVTAVVVLSDGLWRTKFGADPNVLGRSVVLDDAAYVVVGVMPPGFVFPTRDIEIWVPLRFTRSELEDRDDVFLHVVARLKDGVSLDQARSEMRVIAGQLERAHPVANAQTSTTIHRLRDQVSQQARTMLTALVAAALCMLLISCTNLANLLLARALGRERELAVRLAVGAGGRRIVRQMLTESLVLATLGGLVGLLLAAPATALVSRLVPTTMPIPDVPSVDLRMLALAAVVTLCTGIGFGIVPALRVVRSTDLGALREGTRAVAGRATERLRSALIVAQVTASIVLLVTAALLVRALWRVQQIDPGFQTDNVLTMRTALPLPKYAPTARRQQFYDQVVSEVRALPGVSDAAYISFLPMVMRGGIWPVTVDGRRPDPAESQTASLRLVTPGFFHTLGIPVHRGRDVSLSDTSTSHFVAVVSESFAARHWPGQDPLSRRLLIGLFERTVVGVVGNIRVRGLERESEPQVYVPSRQVPDGGLIFYHPKDLVISASVPVPTLVPAIRQVIARADPQQPISEVRLVSEIVHAETAARRAQLRVLLLFGGLACLLAAVGIHGLLAFAVSSRTREIGVRIALGARARAIVSMIVGRALVLSAAGVVAGAVLGVAAGRTLQALLAGVNPLDPPVFATAAALAVVMTLGGCVLPVLRAVRIDPMAAIRSE